MNVHINETFGEVYHLALDLFDYPLLYRIRWRQLILTALRLSTQYICIALVAIALFSIRNNQFNKLVINLLKLMVKKKELTILTSVELDRSVVNYADKVNGYDEPLSRH